MNDPSFHEHNQAVKTFLERAKQEDPDTFEEVMEKYPCLDAKDYKRNQRREVLAGLLGIDGKELGD